MLRGVRRRARILSETILQQNVTMNASTTKQKLVIVLQGIHDSGKTTTLLLLIQLLLGAEGSSLLEEDRKDLRGEDRRVLISYQGKTVYVATPGDLEEVTEESVRHFQEKDYDIKDYDILVTAALSRGKTHAPIKKYVLEHSVQAVWVKKRRVKEGRDEVNRAQAQELKDRIDAFIKAHP